jgi:hypothetical protein
MSDMTKSHVCLTRKSVLPHILQNKSFWQRKEVASETQDEPKELLVLNDWQSKCLAKHVMWKLKSIMKAAYVDCLYLLDSKLYVSQH